MFLRSAEWSWLTAIMMRALWHQENLTIVIRKSFKGLQLLHTNWKDISHDSDGIAYVIGRLWVTIRSLLSLTGWRWKNLLMSFTTGTPLVTIWPSTLSAYTMSRYKYQLMHLGFLIQLTETQFPPPSPDFPWYRFWPQLRLPPTRFLWKDLGIKRTFSAGLWYGKSFSAGPFRLRA